MRDYQEKVSISFEGDSSRSFISPFTFKIQNPLCIQCIHFLKQCLSMAIYTIWWTQPLDSSAHGFMKITKENRRQLEMLDKHAGNELIEN